MNNKSYKTDKLLRIREDVIIPIDKIDVIVKTKIDPKTGNELSSPVYVIYMTNGSRYNWISVSEEHFNKYIKKYINNF